MIEKKLLPYEKNALEPFIGSKTLEVHYEKHHMGYLKKLNAALENTSEVDKNDLEKIIVDSKEKNLTSIYQNACQYWNHNFYWESMSPEKKEISSAAKDLIEKNFGSMDEFKEVFVNKGTEIFGSGWLWLVKNTETGKITLEETKNEKNFVGQKNIEPLLVCDVWEHAYYLDFQNARKKYLEGFVGYINWSNVA